MECAEERISKFLEDQGITSECPREAIHSCFESKMLGKRRAPIKLEELCFKLVNESEAENSNENNMETTQSLQSDASSNER